MHQTWVAGVLPAGAGSRLLLSPVSRPPVDVDTTPCNGTLGHAEVNALLDMVFMAFEITANKRVAGESIANSEKDRGLTAIVQAVGER
ncbi:hypothetical protein [Nonomuraea sp. B19D2]|uniref:hypothetical protein n=1 Tax=Nonomuraea sp. B19D2 TaxID=3159561 RepID=UPI0032D9F9A5